MTTPNVLMVSIDSLRADFCSFLNEDECTTPYMREIADNSTVFTKTISPSIWTLQVHASIFTGLYPPEHGLHSKGQVLGDHPTLAELLSDQKYDTKSFSRSGWFNSAGITRGFDHHHFTDLAPEHIRGEASEVVESIKNGSISGFLKGLKRTTAAIDETLSKQVFRHTMKDKYVVDATIEAIESADEPFFYFTHLNDVHVDYEPVAPFHRSFGDHSWLDRLQNLRYQRHIHWNQSEIYAGRMEIDKDQIPITEDLYRGCIKQADSNIKQIVESLKQAGVYENTILVLFSDHGDQLGWNDMMSHQFSVCDDLLRVPMVVRDPTGMLDAEYQDEVTQLNDLYPTLLSLTGIDGPETLSCDLTTEPGRESAFVYYRASNDFLDRVQRETGLTLDAFPPTKQYAVWESPKQKVIWYPEENQYDGPAADNTELRQKLHNHHDSLEHIGYGVEEELSEGVKQNLREMGYI